jgi:hypothetical protein
VHWSKEGGFIVARIAWKDLAATAPAGSSLTRTAGPQNSPRKSEQHFFSKRSWFQSKPSKENSRNQKPDWRFAPLIGRFMVRLNKVSYGQSTRARRIDGDPQHNRPVIGVW